MLVVIAATMAPVSSYWHIFSVIAERITAKPVQRGLLFEFACRVLDAARQGLIGTEQQADRPLQRKPGFADHVAQRRVGGQAQRPSRPDEAQVVAAAGADRLVRPPVAARTYHHSNARMAVQRPHAPHQLRRPEKTVALEKARRKVDDFDALAVAIEQPRAHDRGSGVVALLASRQSFELDGARPVRADAIGGVEQRAKDRVAVEARHAAPDHTGLGVDQRADRAVADHRELQARLRSGMHWHEYNRILSCLMIFSGFPAAP